jgi:adenylate kinase family enzyme
VKPQRVAVVGNAGSGKTALSRRVASRLGCAHIELDGIHHLPDWTPIDRNEMRTIVSAHIRAESWVVDGNYGTMVQDLVFAAADTVAWLDFPRRIVTSRIVRRSLSRVFLRRELWNGNRERARNLLQTDPYENIILWSITQHSKYRRQYEEAMANLAYSHLEWRRFTTTQQAQAWLETL